MVSLYIPQTDDLFEIELSYITYERIVMMELMRAAEDALIQEYGDDGAWVLFNRADHAEMVTKKHLTTPRDPLFYLGSYIGIETSPLRSLLPFNQYLKGLAKLVRGNRNLWAHYNQPEKRSEIVAAINTLCSFSSGLHMLEAEAAGVAIKDRLSEIAISRARLIAGGQPAKPVEATNYDPVDQTTTQPSQTEPLPSRPRIGGRWEHALPETVLSLNTKYRDVLDATGQSVSKQLGGAAAKAIRRWLHMSINSWLYVDRKDGATVALVDGDPYLIGYLGDEPPLDHESYRGFFLPGVYENQSGRLLNIESLQEFSSNEFDLSPLTIEWVMGNIPSEANVMVTDYGDVVLVDDSGSRRLLTLEEKSQ